MNPESPPAPSNDPIIARGGTYYRNTRYIMTAVLFAMAGWFAYDGWVAWPRLNEQYQSLDRQIDDARAAGEAAKARGDKDRAAAEKKKEQMLFEQQKDVHPKDDLAIGLQKVLAIGLPLLGLALTAWAIRNSRGQIKLTGERLEAPGHPPITFDHIIALDKRLWDRKDIAYVDYEVDATKGRIRLDAFVYQTDPIVKIYERIEAFMKEESVEPPPGV